MLLFTNIALQKSYLLKNNKIGTNYYLPLPYINNMKKKFYARTQAIQME